MTRHMFLTRLLRALPLVLLCCITTITHASDPNEPIAFIGHGVMFDHQGNEIELTPEFVEQTLAWYRENLYRMADDEQQAGFDEMGSRLSNETSWGRQADMVANAALVEHMITTLQPDDMGRMAGKLNLLKGKLQYDLSDPSGDTLFTLPAELNSRISEAGSGSETVLFSTLNSGQAYINECASNDVPTPPSWGDFGPGKWVDKGTLTSEFLAAGNDTEVYVYDSTVPDGLCIALPRHNGTTIGALGIICLGKASSKACFWDNQQNDVPFPVAWGTTVPLINFAGGAELKDGGGGVCSDCHAGQNPYVIHPGTPLGLPVLAGLDLKADNWYDPLVHPDWPQNAGPGSHLDGVTGTSNCTSCHTETGQGGAFPKISSILNGTLGYCNTVLINAINNTMPSTATAPDSDYATQANALRAACTTSPSPVIRFDDTTLDYQEVELGFSFKKALVIHNDGDAPLTYTITETNSSDPDRTMWSVRTLVSNQTLDPGDPPGVHEQTYTPTALGNHTITYTVTSNASNGTSQTITLTGSGGDPSPIDTILVLDRSGSMDDVLGGRRKIDAMRDAASLYADLLRENIGSSGSGDKLGFVKYNNVNSVYMSFDFITPAKRTEINNKLSNAALNNISDLKPDEATGIGGAMQTAAGQLGGPTAGRQEVMVVLTDGKENRTPWIADVLPGIESGNTDLQLYSVGLGTNFDADKLQAITNMGTGGYHQVSAALEGVKLFDLETFYFKIFANATGMDLVVDPTHVIDLLNPAPQVVDTAKIISSDRNATFLVLDDPVLRQFYDLEFVSPTGTIITPGVNIGGIPVQESARHTYRIYRIVFPDIANDSSYIGEWELRLTPNGSWNRGLIKNLLAESAIGYTNWVNPYDGKVPVGFAAAVNSDYSLSVQVTASNYLPGDTLRMQASLSDRGWPAPSGSVNVSITAPDGSTHHRTLFDDGSHGDEIAGDATFTNSFSQTALSGHYGLLFRSSGSNHRGELAPREASRTVTLVQPSPTPGDDDSPCIPCLWLRIFIILALLLLLMLWYCCCRRKRG